MASFKKCVPRFGSQQDSSQTSGAGPDQHTETCVQSRRKQKGCKPRATLKVQLPQFSCRTLLEKGTGGNKTPARWILELGAANTSRTGAPKGKTRCNISTEVGKRDVVKDSEPANASSFFSSQGSNDKPTSAKEKTPAEGASVSICAAAASQMEAVGACYLYNGYKVQSSQLSYHMQLQRELWKKSCQLCGLQVA